MEHLIQPKQSSKLNSLVEDLSNNLTSLQPDQSKTKLITYALIATAVVGITVYHYIRENERAEDLKEKLN